MAKAFALHPVEHDGKLYLFGEELTVTDDQLKVLITSGAVTEAKPEFMTEAQHESHQAAKTSAERFRANTADLDAERAAGVAAEAKHEVEVAQAKADAAEHAAANPTPVAAPVATPVAAVQVQVK